MGGFPTIRHNEIRDITASLLTEVCHNVATEPLGGFPTIRHNEIRDITASLLTEVCHNVATEPMAIGYTHRHTRLPVTQGRFQRRSTSEI